MGVDLEKKRKLLLYPIEYQRGCPCEWVLEFARVGEREIGVYWYLFSNHCSRRCIYETVIKKEKAQLLLSVLELYDSSLLGH